MTCRRCSTSRNVAHYRNDLFDGWFCPGCVDEVVNAYVEDTEFPRLAAMKEATDRGNCGVPWGCEEPALSASSAHDRTSKASPVSLQDHAAPARDVHGD